MFNLIPHISLMDFMQFTEEVIKLLKVCLYNDYLF